MNHPLRWSHSGFWSPMSLLWCLDWMEFECFMDSKPPWKFFKGLRWILLKVSFNQISVYNLFCGSSDARCIVATKSSSSSNKWPISGHGISKPSSIFPESFTSRNFHILWSWCRSLIFMPQPNLPFPGLLCISVSYSFLQLWQIHVAHVVIKHCF